MRIAGELAGVGRDVAQALTVASRGEIGRSRGRAYVEDGRLCLGKVR